MVRARVRVRVSARARARTVGLEGGLGLVQRPLCLLHRRKRGLACGGPKAADSASVEAARQLLRAPIPQAPEAVGGRPMAGYSPRL